MILKLLRKNLKNLNNTTAVFGVHPALQILPPMLILT
jgi:hypothetical protein